MDSQQAMSLLRHQFPEFEDHSAESTQLCGRLAERSVDLYDFALFVTELHEQADDAQLQSVFALMEEFLVDGTPDVRDWVCDWLEALQNVIAWRRYGPTAFTSFLGGETRALWDSLDAIRRASFELDLTGCSVLEAEILTWRFSREKARALLPAA
jgi:hypothetical protein